jgi:hypothetical protein
VPEDDDGVCDYYVEDRTVSCKRCCAVADAREARARDAGGDEPPILPAEAHARFEALWPEGWPELERKLRDEKGAAWELAASDYELMLFAHREMPG